MHSVKTVNTRFSLAKETASYLVVKGFDKKIFVGVFLQAEDVYLGKMKEVCDKIADEFFHIYRDQLENEANLKLWMELKEGLIEDSEVTQNKILEGFEPFSEQLKEIKL